MLGKLGEIARRLGGTVIGDAEVEILTVSAVDEAGPGALTFAVDARYLQAALRSNASAVLADVRALPEPAPSGKPLVVVDDARIALVGLLAALRAPRPTDMRMRSARLAEALAWPTPDIHEEIEHEYPAAH